MHSLLMQQPLLISPLIAHAKRHHGDTAKLLKNRLRERHRDCRLPTA